MSSGVIEKLNRENIPADGGTKFDIGDNVRVHCKIYEGEKQRIQIYAGTVIARDGGGNTETFTVRRVTHGVGVEKVFPVHSPHIEQIEVVRSSHVRRGKLYFMRKLTGKKARLKEKINR